ncbi:hypothetical protein BKA70DRAFT_1223287 [Coprinopsis sp. MPI-PUGE-AT-0042]|nr:hypothetical protein BKA70DRAFT_1223287 [Coprinopsis sp. MPI-PUGE-AT-0042]
MTIWGGQDHFLQHYFPIQASVLQASPTLCMQISPSKQIQPLTSRRLSSMPSSDLHETPWSRDDDYRPVAIPAWHPKLTGSRLFVIFTTLSLGTAKAVLAMAEGDSSVVAPVTIEWVSSTLIFVIFLVLGNLETRDHVRPKWFFQQDALELLWNFLDNLSIRPPTYTTDEMDTNLLLKPRYPPITGYRLLVTFLTVGFGVSKAVLSYQGKSTGPVTLEWIFGAFITAFLYYLGLFEASSTRVLPWLFEEDFTNLAVLQYTLPRLHSMFEVLEPYLRDVVVGTAGVGIAALVTISAVYIVSAFLSLNLSEENGYLPWS